MMVLNLSSSFARLLVIFGAIGLVACETTASQKFQQCPVSDVPIEGRIDDYFPCMQVHRNSPHLAFKLSTHVSGIDKTDDVEKRVIWPHVEAFVGTNLLDLQTRIYFSVWPFDQKNKIKEDPPLNPLKARISGWLRLLPVSYLRREFQSDMEMGWETDYYSIALDPSFIENLIAANPSGDLGYIGEAFTVDIARLDYEDLSFEMNPSEILAAVYAAKTGFSCPPNKTSRATDTDYYESCRFTVPFENDNL